MSFLDWLLNPASIWFETIPVILILLFAAGLFISAVGFVRLVWFISIGYGFSIACMAIISGAYYLPVSTVTGIFHAVLLSVYGLRLGIYLAMREIQPSYKKEQAEIKKEYPARTIFLKIVIWISVAALYVIMSAPLVFHLQAVSMSSVHPVVIIGLAVGFTGLLIESAADFQKSAAKKKNPSRYCDTGLYRIVRSPNYFGEILVWLGSFAAALPFYGSDPWRWFFALTG
ncbi:MAG: DUF1295 domain-containing protein, partial [Spirochaetaceae bacterium]